MGVDSVSNSQSAIADLTRLAVAAHTANRAEQASSVAVQALQLQNVKALASGRLDTYA